MKRWIILFASLFVGAVLLMYLLFAIRRPARDSFDVESEDLDNPKVGMVIGPETFAKLVVGMSESEIVAVLGGPAGDYRAREEVSYVFKFAGQLPRVKPVTKKEWKTDDYAIQVRFGPDGKAILIMGAHGVDIPGKVANPALKTIWDLSERPVTTGK
jgi:hypothetical protein